MRDAISLAVERHFEDRGARRLDYCSSRGARDGAAWMAIRAERVVAEAAHLAERYRLSEILFHDEDFFGDPKRVDAIAQGLADGGGRLGWQAGARPQDVVEWGPERLRLLAESGCRKLHLGVAPGVPPRDLLLEVGSRLHEARLAARFVFDVAEPDRGFDGLAAAVAVARSLCALDGRFETSIRRVWRRRRISRKAFPSRLGAGRGGAVEGRASRAAPGSHDLLLLGGAAGPGPPAGQARGPSPRSRAGAARLLRARRRSPPGGGLGGPAHGPLAARPTRRLRVAGGTAPASRALPRGRRLVAAAGRARGAGCRAGGGRRGARRRRGRPGRALSPAGAGECPRRARPVHPAAAGTAALRLALRVDPGRGGGPRAPRAGPRGAARGSALPRWPAQPPGRRRRRPAPPPRPPLARAGRLPGAGAAPVRLRALAGAHPGPAPDVSHLRPPRPVAGAGGGGLRPGPAGRARRAGRGERAEAEHRDRPRHGARAGGRPAPGGGPRLGRLVPGERHPPLRPDGPRGRAAGRGGQHRARERCPLGRSPRRAVEPRGGAARGRLRRRRSPAAGDP